MKGGWGSMETCRELGISGLEIYQHGMVVFCCFFGRIFFLRGDFCWIFVGFLVEFCWISFFFFNI